MVTGNVPSRVKARQLAQITALSPKENLSQQIEQMYARSRQLQLELQLPFQFDSPERSRLLSRVKDIQGVRDRTQNTSVNLEAVRSALASLNETAPLTHECIEQVSSIS